MQNIVDHAWQKVQEEHQIQEILSSCGVLQILREISFRFDLLNIRIREVDQEIKPFSPHEK